MPPRDPAPAERRLSERGQHYTDEDIRNLVHGLASLQGGKLAAAALVGCGERAIPALRDFLLNGRPRGVFQPRQLAVETLAELRAEEVLMEYLRQPKAIADPVVRFGEDAVVSTAARLLAQWPSDDVFQILCAMAGDHMLLGVIEGLAEFRRPEAAPYLVRALADDVCRRAAEAGLLALGVQAQPALITAAHHPEPSGDDETPSSRIRRRSALRILSCLNLSPNLWAELRPLAFDADAEISFRASQVGLQIAPPEEKQFVFHQMLQALPRVNWFVRSEARDCLRKHLAEVRPFIRSEIARRTEVSADGDSMDIVRTLLVSVMREAEKQASQSE